MKNTPMIRTISCFVEFNALILLRGDPLLQDEAQEWCGTVGCELHQSFGAIHGAIHYGK